jgi:RNA polymerase sigma factor (TIGR02999 family)
MSQPAKALTGQPTPKSRRQTKSLSDQNKEVTASKRRQVLNMTPSLPNVTAMLRDWSNGDREAQGQLFQAVYNELHSQAARYLRHEQPGLSLQTTDLIHEAYLRLIDQQHVEWQNRLHFFGIAAQIMRRILVDHARSRQAAKRGGSAIRLPLEEAMVVLPGQDLDFVALDEALNKLAEIDPQQSRVVELRFFSGLSVAETAKVLDVSERTVKRDWNVAKAWLRRELSRGGQAEA